MAKRSFIADAANVSGSNFLNILIQVIIGIVLARSLGPEGSGLYTYLLVVPMLVGTITRLGMKKSSMVFIGKKVFTVEEIISGLTIMLIVTSAMGMIVTAGIFIYSGRTDISLAMAVLAICSIPVNIIINYSTGIFLGTDNIKRYNVFQWIPSFANLILFGLFVAIFHWSIAGALMAYLLSSLLMALYALRLIFKEYELRLSLSLNIIRQMIRLGFMFTLTGIIIKLHYRIDIIILERFADIREVGYYSLATRIAEKWQGPLTVGAVISSRAAMAEDMHQFKYNILRWIRGTFIIGIFAGIALWFIVPYLVPLLYGDKFIPSIKMVQLILPGILMLIISKTLISFYIGSGKPLPIFIMALISLILNMGLNFILIPRYGGVGAAISTDVSYFVLAVMLMTNYTISLKIPTKYIFSFERDDLRIIRRIRRKLFRF
jgi:O-antigen/teichoic acid export membrane protein